MKKLLIVAEFDSLNGGENSMLAVLPLLIESGWRIKIAFPGRADDSDQPGHQTLTDRLAGLDVRPLRLATHLADGTRKSQSEYRSGFADLLKSQLPDLVLCNSLSISRLCGPVTSELNVPAVGYLRDIISLSKTAVADINQLDRIVAVSQATKDFHADQGMEASKIEVIHNGVDLDLFCPRESDSSDDSSIKSELNIPNDSPAILFVGQIGLRKGVDVLLNAFERIITRVPKCHLLIVGQRHSVKQESVDYEKELILRSRDPKFSSQVHWLQRRDDMPGIYRDVDLLLHPARQEPLGRVLLEAISSGLPLVTTAVGGSPEILGEVKSADLLCPVDDAPDMAKQAVMILENKNLHDKVSAEVRKIAVERFGRQRCFQALDGLLENMLAATNSI